MNPENQTTGQSTPQTPPLPVNSQLPPNPNASIIGGPRKRSVGLWIVLAIVVIAVIVGLVFALKPDSSKDDQSKNLTTSNSNNPDHIDGIAVGPYRYVNACDAFPYNDEYTDFAGISETALYQDKYAENGLPVKDIRSQGVLSTCSRTFGSDTAYANSSVLLSIYQFPTTKEAQDDFDENGLTVSQLKSGTTVAENNPNVTALSGIGNSIFDADTDTSYTLLNNMVISLSATLVGVDTGSYKAAVTKSLPAIIKNASDQKLFQGTAEDEDFGKKLGDATYVMACKLFTADDYQKMTGQPADPSEIDFQYNYNKLAHPSTDLFEGEADMSCTRQSAPSAKTSHYVTLQVQYFKSAAEASAQINQHFSDLSSESDFKVQKVTGTGDNAIYWTSTDGDNLATMDVQKGPYILDFVMPGPNQDSPAPVSDYTKAANVLLPKLPQ